LTQGSAINLRVGELYEENAPRLAGNERAELADGTALKKLRGLLRQSEVLAGPIKRKFIRQGVGWQRPAQIVSQEGK
jgi:hypothetical protein